MTVDEFIARTGYSREQAENEWTNIIREYLKTDEHKNIFCRRWERKRAMERFLQEKQSDAR